MLLNLKKKEIRFCLYDFEKYFYFLKILKMAMPFCDCSLNYNKGMFDGVFVGNLIVSF